MSAPLAGKRNVPLAILNVATLLMALAVTPSAWSQLSTADIEELKRDLAGQGALIFTRISSSGVFGGCELQFSAALRDWRSKEGGLVKIAGAVSSYYIEKKAFNVNLKLLGEDLLIHPNGTTQWQSFRPFDGAFKLGKTVIPSNRAVAKFNCEPKAICLGFAEPGLLDAFVDALLTESIEVLFTRGPGSTDLVLNLARIKPRTETVEHYHQFLSCYQEFLNNLVGN